MLAVKLKNVKMTNFLISKGADLRLKDLQGLNAFEQAAIEGSIEIFLLLDSIETFRFNSFSIYVLEVLEELGTGNYLRLNEGKEQSFSRIEEATMELIPIDGYWEWITEWNITTLSSKQTVLSRLRKKITVIEPVYLKQAIDLIQSTSTSTPDYQTALNLLLEGLQHETDHLKKSRVAAYFQRLLVHVEASGIDNFNFNGRSLRLNVNEFSIKSDEGTQIVTMPPVTKVFNTRNKFENENNESYSESESDDSLLYCPACSHRFSQDRETHLKTCLTSPRSTVIGDRYTSLSDTSNLEGECPICYEEMGGGSCSGGKVVVMNCFCKYHEKCIGDWIGRGKQCPYHSE